MFLITILIVIDINEGFCWCCDASALTGECWRPVGKGPCQAQPPLSSPVPGAAVHPPKAFPPPPQLNSQSGVDIACTNSKKTSKRQGRRPKALATYPGSPHAAFVVRSIAWLG